MALYFETQKRFYKTLFIKQHVCTMCAQMLCTEVNVEKKSAINDLNRHEMSTGASHPVTLASVFLNKNRIFYYIL